MMIKEDAYGAFQGAKEGAYGAMQGAKLGAYGAIQGATSGFKDLTSGGLGALKSVSLPTKEKSRKKMNFAFVCACILLPWLAFSAVSWSFSFSVHYKMPIVAYLVLLLSFMLTGMFGALSYAALLKSKQNPKDHYSTTWYVYLAIVLLVGTVVGWWLGDLNYYTNMQQYYDLKALASYYNIDPAVTSGRQVIDAGQVFFKKGAGVSREKAYVFNNNYKYCVAPISNFVDGVEVDRLKTYDFWAIGLNCCGANRTDPIDYKCGAYNDKKASQGLRLMRDDQRQFFRLAVQQAEAAHKIQAIHPVFFFWTDDVEADLDNLKDVGYSYFYLGVLLFFIGVMLSAMVSIFIFTKMGY